MPYNSATDALRRGDMQAQLGDAAQRLDTTTYAWSFRTPQVAATVETAAFFNICPADFLPGDTISAIMNNGPNQTPVFKSYIVTQVKGKIPYGGVVAANTVIVLQTGTAG